MTAKLRVGLLLDSVFLPAWEYTALERLVRSNCVELVLVVLNHSRSASRSAGMISGQDAGHWLYHVFNSIDEKMFVRGPNALAQVDAEALLSGLPAIDIKPAYEDEEQYLCDADVEEIRSYKLDILVKMGFGRLTGDVLSVATHGIWSYRWGDARKIEDGLTGFWEVVKGWPETGAALQQLRPDPEHNVTLFESWFSTYPFSPARNRNYILWSAASFLPRQVERLYQLGGEKYFQGLKKHKDEIIRGLKTNCLPSNPTVLWILVKLTCKNLIELYRRSFHRERWELLFNLEPAAKLNIAGFKKISPPKDRFWADPHVAYVTPNYYVFVEEYLYRTQKGRISVIEMDQAGNYKQPIPVLQEDYHLSFPFVFDWLGHYYMIPESSEKHTVDLYECVEFPYQWKRRLTLMKDIKAVDTTVVYIQGKWWLFTAIAEQEAAAPQFELFLFYSDDLFTDQWTPHPMNPIVSDVKRARGAGRIFQMDGRLMRPSQDCSIRYGYSFDLNEIVVLSESEYRERRVTTVRPDPLKGFVATHTFASLGDLTVIDALAR